MALQVSGPISIEDVAAEFGGVVPHALDEYREKGNAPAVGPIDLDDFYGASNYAVDATIVCGHYTFGDGSGWQGYRSGASYPIGSISNSGIVGGGFVRHCYDTNDGFGFDDCQLQLLDWSDRLPLTKYTDFFIGYKWFYLANCDYSQATARSHTYRWPEQGRLYSGQTKSIIVVSQ